MLVADVSFMEKKKKKKDIFFKHTIKAFQNREKRKEGGGICARKIPTVVSVSPPE